MRRAAQFFVSHFFVIKIRRRINGSYLFFELDVFEDGFIVVSTIKLKTDDSVFGKLK